MLTSLKEAGIRAEFDERNEKIGYKIRQGQMAKIPYLLVVGAKEVEEGTVSIRKHGGEDLGIQKTEDFIGILVAESTARQ